MARLPSFDLYNEAVQHPRTAFADQELQQGSVRTNGLGLPQPLSGGFALTYRVDSNRRRHAVRVFHKDSPGLEERYARISAALRSNGNPYFVPFEYQPRGIRVQGGLYPLVKMEWVEGATLGSFLEAHFANASRITRLRESFRALGRTLRAQGIAHGDLQNGNVILRDDSLVLVDYDGMYVAGMRAEDGSELGHRHFQHPTRRPVDFGATLDRFSLILIDLSLTAIAMRPELFTSFSTTGENLLFTATDLRAPGQSALFKELGSMRELRPFVEAFAALCTARAGEVPTLEDFLAGRGLPSRPVASPARPLERPRYDASIPVIDATDFPAATCHVGDRVEVIGCITDVKVALTRKRRREYAFVNFGNWRGQIVKLNIWPSGLTNLSTRPDKSWVGRWVSVSGLMDPPYSSPLYGYTHLSVTVEDQSQLHFLDEREARYRLGAAQRHGSPGPSVDAKPSERSGARASPRTHAMPAPRPNSDSSTTASKLRRSVFQRMGDWLRK